MPDAHSAQTNSLRYKSARLIICFTIYAILDFYDREIGNCGRIYNKVYAEMQRETRLMVYFAQNTQ